MQVRSWSAFLISSEFFLATTTGRKLLYLEADTTNSEASLQLGAKAADLTMEDASQAFLLIRRAARLWRLGHKHAKPFRTFRVVLGNPRQLERTASRSRTLRERIDKLNQADVIVDSQAPVIGEVLRWCNQVSPIRSSKPDGSDGGARGSGHCSSGSNSGSGGCGGRLPSQTIVFETDSKEYFNALERALQPFGYAVMDPATAEALEADAASAAASRDATVERLPRLVYCTTTAETTNAVQALVKPRRGRRGMVDANRCCALLDRAESVNRLEDAHDEAHNRHQDLQQELLDSDDVVQQAAGKIHIICTAVLYDDLLRQVRVWARLGHSPAEIQKELDGRFGRVAAVLEAMTASKKAPPPPSPLPLPPSSGYI